MSAFGGTKFGGVFQNQVEVVKASMRIKLYFNNKHYKEIHKKNLKKTKSENNFAVASISPSCVTRKPGKNGRVPLTPGSRAAIFSVTHGGLSASRTTD